MVGTRVITFQDVVRAGRLLFGPDFAVETVGWRDALKATYRRRAMQTHPDRARALGRPERDLAREFESITDAYRILSALRSGSLPRGAVRGAPRASPSTPRPAWGSPERVNVHAPPSRAGPSAQPRVRVGMQPEELPRRRLRFAEYLYYSGRVGWTELVAAIAWQRTQRPPLGKIAVALGFLTPEQVGALLERRRAAASRIPFGEWAVHLGYLTPFQVLAALGHQLRNQRRIGQYFVERGIIEPEEIDVIRRRILQHNVRFQSG